MADNNGNGNSTGSLLKDILAKGGVATLILCVAGYWMATEVVTPLKNKHIELIDYLKSNMEHHDKRCYECNKEFTKILEKQADCLANIEKLQYQTCTLLRNGLEADEQDRVKRDN